jgi:hypothetical protein
MSSPPLATARANTARPPSARWPLPVDAATTTGAEYLALVLSGVRGGKWGTDEGGAACAPSSGFRRRGGPADRDPVVIAAEVDPCDAVVVAGDECEEDGREAGAAFGAPVESADGYGSGAGGPGELVFGWYGSGSGAPYA